MSASAKTTLGDFPPSSSDTRLSDPAASRMMPLPTSVEPVKRDLVDARMPHEGHPDLAAGPRHDVEHALGQAGLAGQLARSGARSGV